MKKEFEKIISTIVLLLAINFAYSQGTIDSSKFQFQSEHFLAEEKLNFFKSTFGYIISYPENWERDKRTQDNLIFYLRKIDEKNKSQFIEMVTVIREHLEDSTKSLKEYAVMQNNIALDTWAKYQLEYTVLAEESFQLSGIDAIQILSELKKIAQKKLVILFIRNNYAYKIEFTATQISYTDFIKQVRCMVNTFAFVE